MLPTKRRCSLPSVAVAILLCVQSLLCVSSESALAADAMAEPRPCVLLTNDNVLYGIAKQQGEWVLIRNGDGNESRLPRQSVACWAASIKDLYQFRVDRRRPGDLYGLVNDARWCLDYDLLESAAELVREIQSIDPANLQARLIDKQIRHRTSPPGEPTVTIPSVHTASHAEPIDVAAVNLADLRAFASQVQPMLANRCGNCHADPSDREWSLILPAHGARPSSRMTRENLQRCIAILSAESPDQSLLFVKAISPHGGVDAPLDPRDSKAIDVLRFWVRQAAASILVPANEKVGFDSSPQALPPPVLAPSSATEETFKPAMENALPADVGSNRLAKPPTVLTAGRAAAVINQPTTASRLPQVSNPFDPEIFNRKFHPPQPPPDTNVETDGQ